MDSHPRCRWKPSIPPAYPPSQSLIARNENTGYYFERHNDPTTDYAVRLFPNRPEYRFRGRVHETIDASILRASGILRKTQIRLDHNFSTDPESRRQRNRWYTRILLEEIAADPTDDTRLDFLAAEYHQQEMYTEAAAVAERIAQIRPQDPRAHLVAGIYHLLYAENPTRARADFEQALRLRPNYPEAESYLDRLKVGVGGSAQMPLTFFTTQTRGAGSRPVRMGLRPTNGDENRARCGSFVISGLSPCFKGVLMGHAAHERR